MKTPSWLSHHKSPLKSVSLALILSLMAAGCGQKGALYLPDTTPAKAGEK